MKKTFDVFLLPEVVQELKKRGRITVAKVYTDTVEAGRKRSRYGYEGDTWYIPEHCRFADKEENIVIFPDGGARKKTGTIGIDIVPPMFYEEAGVKVPASKMPKWAARTWVEITAVHFPKRIQELGDIEIEAMGFNGGSGVYEIGDLSMQSRMDLKTVFATWWNENMGGWRVIKKGGVPSKVVCYPYADGMPLRDIDDMGLERQVHVNPWIICYSVKLI